MGLQKRIACNRISACKIGKGVSFTHFNKKKKNTHISCIVTVALHLIFYYFFLFPLPHSLFFSLVLLTLTSLCFFFLSLSSTSHSHLTLVVPLIFAALSPQLCHRWSPHLSMLSSITVAFFFLCLMVFGFWLVGFGGFDQWFLMILISGF